MTGSNALDELQTFIDEKRTWLFGHLGYDLKSETERDSSLHPDLVQFPDLFFFEPEIVIRLNEKEMVVEGEEPAELFETINSSLADWNKDAATHLADHRKPAVN